LSGSGIDPVHALITNIVSYRCDISLDSGMLTRQLPYGTKPINMLIFNMLFYTMIVGRWGGYQTGIEFNLQHESREI
jgi:hypothetical protein